MCEVLLDYSLRFSNENSTLYISMKRRYQKFVDQTVPSSSGIIWIDIARWDRNFRKAVQLLTRAFGNLPERNTPQQFWLRMVLYFSETFALGMGKHGNLAFFWEVLEIIQWEHNSSALRQGIRLLNFLVKKNICMYIYTRKHSKKSGITTFHKTCRRKLTSEKRSCLDFVFVALYIRKTSIFKASLLQGSTRSFQGCNHFKS